MKKPHPLRKILRGEIQSFTIKNRFELPGSNRYFSKVLKNHNIISTSMDDIHYQRSALEGSNVLNRSMSLSMSKKMSQNRDLMPEIKGSFSLPKIDSKQSSGEEISSQIIRSQFGCFNVYKILKVKEEIDEELKRKLLSKRVTRMSSLHEDEHDQDNMSSNEEEVSIHSNEIAYEEYDKDLLKKQPVLYHRREMRLRHKADWRIIA